MTNIDQETLRDLERLQLLLTAVEERLPNWQLSIVDGEIILRARAYNAIAQHWARSEYREEDGVRVRVVRG